MEDKMIEGKLYVKHDEGGWRHYIQDCGQDHNIAVGSYMEVQLGWWQDDGHSTQVFHGEWLRGHYEAYLTGEPIKAYLSIGTFPDGRQAMITIPLGTMVRVLR